MSSPGTHTALARQRTRAWLRSARLRRGALGELALAIVVLVLGGLVHPPAMSTHLASRPTP